MSINLNCTSLSSSRRGFTLLEILIAVFILVTVLTTVYAAYRGTLGVISGAEEDGVVYGTARTVMERMFNDLSSVSPKSGTVKFISRSRREGASDLSEITFTSNAHLAFSEKDPPAGIAEITYSLGEAADRENGRSLLRKDILSEEENGAADAGEDFVLGERLQSLRFRFYDRTGREYDEWDSTSNDGAQKNRAPAVVDVEIELVNKKNAEQPYVFTTKVFIPLGEAFSAKP